MAVGLLMLKTWFESTAAHGFTHAVV